MEDEYTHIEDSIFYVAENIMGPQENTLEYEKLCNDFNSQLAEHCNCYPTCCNTITCDCLQKSFGDNYSQYDSNDLLKYKLNSQTQTKPIIECSDLCICTSDCPNRVVQKGPIKGLEIKSCDKGLGLYSKNFIPEGAFVCEYAGEIITKSQAHLRHEANRSQGKNNYIFCLKEHSDGKIHEFYIDPSCFGNIGRYINHSCEPNCYIVPVRCGCPIPKLAIFASRDISTEEELTFNYGSKDEEFIDKDILQHTKCLCKSKSCTGFLPFQNF